MNNELINEQALEIIHLNKEIRELRKEIKKLTAKQDYDKIVLEEYADWGARLCVENKMLRKRFNLTLNTIKY